MYVAVKPEDRDLDMERWHWSTAAYSQRPHKIH